MVVSPAIVGIQVYFSNKVFRWFTTHTANGGLYICVAVYHLNMVDDVTTVKVSTDTWKRLNQRKEPGDSFDEVISKLLDEVESSE